MLSSDSNFLDAQKNLDFLPEEPIPLDITSLLALEQERACITLPKFLFGTEAYNTISFHILKRIYASFYENQDYLHASVPNPSPSNLTAVFFHEILMILCAYYFKKYEVTQIAEDRPQGTMVYSGSGHPIYVGYEYIFKGPTAINFHSMYKQSVKNRLRSNSKNTLLNMPLLFGWPRKKLPVSVSVCPNIPLGSRDLAKAIRKTFSPKPVRIKFENPQNSKIHLPLFERQLNTLQKHLKYLEEDLTWATGNHAGQADAIFRHLNAWIQYHISIKRIAQPSFDLLITGTLTELQSRIEAAKASAAGLPVISVLHGEACGLHDEPYVGYGENSFAQTIVGYGNLGNKLATKGIYVSPLFGKPIGYVRSSSPKVRKLFRTKKIKRLSALESPTYMYAPTSFSNDLRYGPFRDYHDVVYLDWQRSLLKTLRELVQEPILLKAHPKSKSGMVNLGIPEIGTVVEAYFENALTQADVYVFDYVSSALSLAAATDKPIIYLDIGIRNLSQKALELLRHRCIYVKADIRNPRWALKKALSLSDKSCTNRLSGQFSLTSNELSRSQVVATTAHAVYQRRHRG